MTLSHLKFHAKNLKTIINILLENCYPLDLIFNIINSTINKFAKKSQKMLQSGMDGEILEHKKYFSVYSIY